MEINALSSPYFINCTKSSNKTIFQFHNFFRRWFDWMKLLSWKKRFECFWNLLHRTTHHQFVNSTVHRTNKRSRKKLLQPPSPKLQKKFMSHRTPMLNPKITLCTIFYTPKMRPIDPVPKLKPILVHWVMGPRKSTGKFKHRKTVAGVKIINGTISDKWIPTLHVF